MEEPVANRLLTSLSAASRERITARADAVAMPLRFQAYRGGEVPEFAYFITSGLVSITTATGDGRSAEVCVLGREGYVGGIHLLGPAVGSLSAFMQIEGTGLRIALTTLRDLMRSSEEIRDRMQEFTQSQMLTICTTAACNLLHPAEQRLARWLLTATDRVGMESMNLTQEFLGVMLGVRRTTVNLVVADLSGRGLIHNIRGKIRVVDRAGLKAAACECYGVTAALQQNLYSGIGVEK